MAELNGELAALHQANPVRQLLAAIPGVVPLGAITMALTVELGNFALTRPVALWGLLAADRDYPMSPQWYQTSPLRIVTLSAPQGIGYTNGQAHHAGRSNANDGRWGWFDLGRRDVGRRASIRLVRSACEVSQIRNRSHNSGLLEPVERPQKPWRQLAFVLGEVGLTLVSSGVLFIIISHVSGRELLGAYALALAWMTLFQGVSSFGIPEFLMREAGAHGRDVAGQVVHTMLLGLGSGLVALLLMLAAVRLLGYSPYLVQVITIASLALTPAFLNTACRSVFLALRLMHLTFLGLLVEVTITMSASLYLLLSGHGAIALMIALLIAKIASASIALTLLFCRVLRVRPSLSLDFLLQTARTVFTFGIGNMLGMTTMRVNTIMLSLWVDIATVGQFSAATKIMEIGLIIPNLFAPLLMTRLAYSFNMQGNRDPNRFAAWYQVLFSLVMPVCVGVWVFAGPILETLFGPGFGNAQWVLRILMIYLFIESADAVMSVILKATYRHREDVTRLAFNPLINILLNLLLLPTLGTIGAAIGRVGGVSASAILRNLLISQKMTAVNWLRFALKPTFISIVVGAACYLVFDFERPAWSLLIYALVTAASLTISSAFSLSAIKDMMRFPTSEESSDPADHTRKSSAP